jgi:NodT family efflux transporter outer membrane factor (OMF) lipoprotein
MSANGLKLLLIGGLAGFLGACAPKVTLPSQTVALPAEWRNQSSAKGTMLAKPDWWRQLEDPVLNQLVETALIENPGLQQALARVEAARALVTQARAQGLPGLDFGAGTQIQRPLKSPGNQSFSNGGVIQQSGGSKTTGVFQGQVSTSWELDVFGRVREGVRSAKAQAAAAEFQAGAARVMLVGDIVQAYVDLRTAQQRRQLVDRSLITQERLVELVGQRAKAGIASDFELNRAKTNLGQTLAERPAALQQEEFSLQRLAILMGRADPDAAWSTLAPLPKLAAVAIMSAPADMLRLRPDVLAAEANVLRASSDVGVAVADLYPRLQLGGEVSLSESVFGGALAGTTVLASVTPRLSMPLWDWGARQSVVKARQAQLKEAIQAYREQVLRAYAEAQNAMVGASRQNERVKTLEAAQKSAAQALSQAEILYTRGLTGLTERLDAESQALRSDLDLLSAQQSAATAIVDLQKALSPADPLAK